VLTALDEVTNLDSTVVGTEADTHVECTCAGIEPGRTYTARQLLDAILLMSGNDAANALADMIGGYDTAVAKMNAKAAAIGAIGTHAATPSGLDGPGGAGATTPRDLAVIFRAAMAHPVFAATIAQPAATFRRPRAISRSSTTTSCCTVIPAPSAARPGSPMRRRRRLLRPPTAADAAW
jgi:D-alanyl-D-alanine carboxypeptidase (penicillin-binding protein 5/6)